MIGPHLARSDPNSGGEYYDTQERAVTSRRAENLPGVVRWQYFFTIVDTEEGLAVLLPTRVGGSLASEPTERLDSIRR